MRERGIEITGDLASALERVLGPRLPDPAEVDVLAAYLDWLSRDFGLSGSAPDVSRSERAQPPDAAVAMVKQFVGDESDSELIDDQLLGDQLYGVLVALTQDGQAGKILNDTKPLTSVELLQLGQIYWNLEGTDARPKLPIRSGESYAIKVPRANADFATMVWSTRLKSGPAGLRDNSFRIKGARLVVLAAERILQTNPAAQLEMERAHFRHGDSKSGEGRISAVYWPKPALGIGSASAPSGEMPRGIRLSMPFGRQDVIQQQQRMPLIYASASLRSLNDDQKPASVIMKRN